MNVVMLSWEYPPRIVGGLGRHVGALARTLVGQGHRVHVVTRAHPDGGDPLEQWRDGVHVVRVTEAPPRIDFDDLVPWVLAFNNRLIAAAGRILADEDVDVVHAHDWLVTYAAAALREIWRVPIVATVHATEYGRHQGWLPAPMNRLIHQVEWWLTYEARRVITCSAYMRDQVVELFELPPDKVVRIPNGVELGDFEVSPEDAATYRAHLVGPRTRMVLFAGRLEYEKGVQTVLRALQRVREKVGPTKLFVAGIGTYSQQLRSQARELGLSQHVRFTGFLEDHDLRRHYAAADVAVTPSIYEPFGLVAVEAMACGTPVVVSDTGGLSEIVADGTGLTVTPGDADELADALIEVLEHAELAHRLVEGGRRRIAARYDWSRVGMQTAQVYGDAVIDEARLRDVDTQAVHPLRLVMQQDPVLGTAG